MIRFLKKNNLKTSGADLRHIVENAMKQKGMTLHTLAVSLGKTFLD